MRFYRQKIKGANGETLHRDYYEEPTGSMHITQNRAVEDFLRGEVDGKTIQNYPNQWNHYLKHLKDAGEPAPDLSRYFEPGSPVLAIDPNVRGKDGKVNLSLSPNTKDSMGNLVPDIRDASGNLVPGLSPDTHGNLVPEVRDAEGNLVPSQGHSARDAQGNLLPGSRDAQGNIVPNTRDAQGNTISPFRDAQGNLLADSRSGTDVQDSSRRDLHNK